MKNNKDSTDAESSHSSTQNSLADAYYTTDKPLDEVGILTSKYYPASFSKGRSTAQKKSDQRKLALILKPSATTLSIPLTTGDKHLEQLVLASKVTKINRKGKRQQRVLVLTNIAIYNYKVGSYSRAKRRIDLMLIESMMPLKVSVFTSKEIFTYKCTLRIRMAFFLVFQTIKNLIVCKTPN